MKNYLAVGIAAALIVSTGVVHAFWTGGFDFMLGKPSPSEQLKVFADNLKNVPELIGQWSGTDLKETDAREREVGGIDASMNREYRNLNTNAKSSVFLVSGHFRNIAVHTPDQCYVAAGYEMMSDTIKYMIETPAGAVEAYTTVFKKEDTHVGTHYLRVFWTWSVDGNWVAPDSPRIEFVGQPALYKMYIITQLEQPGRSISEDPSIGFVGQFIPELNKALFPGESGIGGDTQDALEPATQPASTGGLTVPIAVSSKAPATPPAATSPAGEPPVATPAADAASEGAKPSP